MACELQLSMLKLGHIFSIVNQNDIYFLRKVNDDSFIENNYVWRAPSNITKRKVLNTEVYNFEVAIDNSYIVANTIVHNCQSYSIAGKRDILTFLSLDKKARMANLISNFIEITY
jgi:hypothetical protein